MVPQSPSAPEPQILWQKGEKWERIVEGYARQSKKELKQFLNIALGSLAETEYLLELSKRLDYFNEQDYQELQNLRQEVGNLLRDV